MKQQESITRKKLYKSGKGWVVAATMFAAMGTASVTTVVHADVQQGAAVVATNPNVVDDTTKSTADTNAVDTKVVVETPDTAKATDKVVDTKSSTDKVATDKKVEETAKQVDTGATDKKANPVKLESTDVADKAVTDKKAADKKTVSTEKQEVVTGGRYEIKGDGSIYISKNGEQLTGLQNVDGNVQYFGNDGLQVKGQFVEVNGKTIYLDSNSGNAVANTQKVNGQLQGYDAQGNQVKKSFSNDVSGNTYYFDDSGKMLTGLQSINGQSYYLDEQGQLKKNYSGIFNKQSMYFDADTGVGKTTIEYQFEQGLISQNNESTPHNAAKSYNAKSFENIDGYLTADTWYRPTDILKDGKKWTASSNSDLRPLLMTWWPDKQTQANYLNYMSANGVGPKAEYSANANQSTLNEAALLTQTAIEQKIYTQKSTKWLRDAINSFVKEQDNWNINTEDISRDGLQSFQGGFLAFKNNPKLTPYADSTFRYLGRQPSNIDGNGDIGSEFLLANDVDNSNPIVQAEQLNWLHYLMNFGSITSKNSNANFDGIRIDAADNLDADLLKIAGDYFKASYGTNKSDSSANQHLSIIEGWGGKDPELANESGNPQLTMDYTVTSQLGSSLTHGLENRSGMWYFLDSGHKGALVNRIANSTENTAIPNYSFVRAHDYDAQDSIRQAMVNHGIIKGTQEPFTFAQLNEGIKYYYADQESTIKQYNDYNLPSAYAMLLTNKDTIPRVYYGDMYYEGGQYMAHETIYNPIISALLKARTKYVSGGQTMAVDNDTDLLSSVRFGKKLMTVDDTITQDNKDSQTQGIGVVVGNKTDLQLSDAKTIVLHMGAAHKNQAYRAVALSTDTGINVYNDDMTSPISYTDQNGDLIFHKNNTFKNSDGTTMTYEIKGHSNALISGYLGVWVPVGAADNQDARTAASTDIRNGDSVFRANAALDSNVIYEGFSNFQDMPSNANEYTNVVIARNANLFKSLGITSFELAPQYRSSGDNSFLDAFLNNGYAFTDRYDLGFNNSDGTVNPTKYGTASDLSNAIEALHNAGLQVIADWVPNQIYNLPGKEVVTATRVDERGEQITGTDFTNLLYAANTKSSGSDFQYKYGGAFLNELKEKYPELFEKTQVSTGVAIDSSVKIKEWTAKYFNGSNVLGRGAYYVLQDKVSNQYFNIAKTDKVFLPLQLMNKKSNTGFTSDATGVKYYSTSGYQAKNTFIEDGNGNWYYFDDKGYMVRSKDGKSPLTVINTNTNTNNGTYYFMSNGVELRDGFGQDDIGNTYYFDKLGKMVTNQYISDKANNTYHLNSDGTMSRGLVLIDNNLQYFAANGVQLKGVYAKDVDNKLYYFDANTGNNDSNFANKNWNSNWTTNDYTTIDLDKKINQNLYINSRNDGLFLNAPYRGQESKLAGMTSVYNGQRVQVTLQRKDAYGLTWYLTKVDGKQLWVDSRAFAPTFTRNVSLNVKVNSSKRNDGIYLNAPYGDKKAKRIASTKSYNGKRLKVSKEYRDATGVIWYLVNLDSKQVWIDKRAF